MDKLHSFTHKDCDIIERTPCFDGFLKIRRYQLRFRLFQGGYSPVVTREVLERAKAVAILPYDPSNDNIILIEQFRIGALENSDNPWLFEIIAGLIEPGETPQALAKREALEEANCDLLDLHLIGEYFLTPGGSNEYLYLFCGRIASEQYNSGIFGLSTENENIRTHVVKLDEALDFVQCGKIRTVPAVIALQWLQLNKTRLKQAWQIK